MKYCHKTTTTHSKIHSSCIVDINDLIIKEGYIGINPLFTNTEVVINLDAAEALESAAVGRKEKNKSMDMAFGISNYASTKRQMLLVELKFNVTDLYALKKTDLEEKVAGSSLILLNEPSIYQQFIFIFKTEHLQEAISRLFRMVPRIDSKYVALDINLLKANFF